MSNLPKLPPVAIDNEILAAIKRAHVNTVPVVKIFGKSVQGLSVIEPLTDADWQAIAQLFDCEFFAALTPEIWWSKVGAVSEAIGADIYWDIDSGEHKESSRKRISEEKANAIQKQCAPHYLPKLQPQGALVLMRRGALVWRIPGKAGADLDRPPLGVVIARLEQRHNAELNKIARQTELMLANTKRKGVNARQLKAEKTREAVLSLDSQGKRPDTIVTNLKANYEITITIRRVRQILNAEIGK